MRKQLLTPLAAAAVAAGALALATPSPADAVAWLDNGPINGAIAGNATSLDVASTGPGDAIAAWTVPVGDIDRVYVSRADNGDWGTPTPLSTVGVDTADVHVAANRKGEAIVTWEQAGGGGLVLSGRRLLGGSWTPENESIVPTPSDAPLQHDVALDTSGDAVIAYRVAHDADSTALVTDWPKVGDITASPIDSGPDDEFSPTLAANDAGDVLYSFARGSAIWSTYRPAGSNSWTEAAPVVGNTVSQASSAALRPDGTGVVAATQNAAPDVVRVVEIGADGSPGQSTIVSDTELDAGTGSVTANADGDVLVAWETRDNGEYGVSTAVRPAGGAFTTPVVLLQPSAANSQRPETALADNDVRAVISGVDSTLLAWRRTSGIQGAWEGHSAGPSATPIGQYAVDADAQGNVVVVGSGENTVHAEFLDAAGPSTKVVKPAKAISVTTQPTIAWSVADSLSGIAPTVDVYATTAAWNAVGHGDPSLIVDNAAGGQVTYQATPGTTYCFQVRAQDTAGNSATSPARCSTVPLDDRKLAGTGWTRAEGSGHFLETVTRTSKQGRTLVRKGVHAKRLALVVHKTLKSGSVKVTFGDKVLGTFSLKGKGKHRVINVATFSTVKSGTVKITVTSKGKPVGIDGLVVAQ